MVRIRFYAILIYVNTMEVQRSVRDFFFKFSNINVQFILSYLQRVDQNIYKGVSDYINCGKGSFLCDRLVCYCKSKFWVREKTVDDHLSTKNLIFRKAQINEHNCSKDNKTFPAKQSIKPLLYSRNTLESQRPRV